MRSISFTGVFKNPGFLNLWINQILVQFSYYSLNFALIIWVFHLTDSNTAVAALMISVYLPSLIFGMLAGVFVDMIDRRKIILAIDFLLAILFLVLLSLKNFFPAILVLTFLVNSLAQFFLPAESSALPILVKKHQLFTANSLFSMTLFAMFLIGFGLSGPIIAALGIDFVFILGASTLFLAFILATKFPSITNKIAPITQKMKESLTYWHFKGVFEIATTEVKQTLHAVRGRLPIMSGILLLAIVQTVIGVLATMMPSFLERTLQIEATNASYIIIIPLGLGMVIGALLLGKMGHKVPRRLIVARGVLTSGLILLLVGIYPLISPAIQHFPKPRPLPFIYQPSLSLMMTLGSFLLGVAVVSIIVPSQTVLQEHSSEEERGKIFGVLLALMSGFSLLPILLAGILADFLGTIPLFIAFGGAITILGLLITKPDFFFEERHLPFRIREFLGLGHWRK